jgi:signal transduction histidine kinase/tetratricopeptide (TPR) repeat protein
MARWHLVRSLKNPTFKRNRIVLLFALGIVLPSLVLGYLAFRGIQNDRALLEKERREEIRRTADRIVTEIDARIAAVETALAAASAGSDQESTGAYPETANLERIESGDPLVEKIFTFRRPSLIRFPAGRLLYLPDSEREFPSPEKIRQPVSAWILEAQQLEFQQRNYPRALASYQKALQLAGNTGVQGEILNAVARVQRKASLLVDAAATYETIAREHGRDLLSAGIPLGLAARLELGSLYKDLDDPAKSAATVLELYKSLIHGEWLLEKSQFEFFEGRAKSSLREFLADPPAGLDLTSTRSVFDRLDAEEKENREGTERAIAFQNGAGPTLQAKLGSEGNEPGRPTVRFTLEIGRYSYCVAMLSPRTHGSSQPEEMWGVLLDSDRIRDDVLGPALARYAKTTETKWIVRDREGHAILASDRPSSGPAAFRTGFVSNVPDWSLEFYPEPPDLIRTFFLSRHGVYSYMFLLIAGILVFGLVLTIRTVSRELELARMKSDFVSTISHEFKSPLTSIRQLAEMLHSGRVPSEERRRKYYDVLLEQSERLSLLTDNILSLARIEEGRRGFRFEATDLGVLLREVASSVQDRVRHEDFDISMETEPAGLIADIDRDAVSQALANLLDNAVKYSGESRKIVVRLFSENEEAVITVRDFGVGIRKSDLDKVFDRFYRGGEELTRKVKGSGLGLSLVKEVVEAHRGHVEVESEPGKGSVFTIRLPLRRPQES